MPKNPIYNIKTIPKSEKPREPDFRYAQEFIDEYSQKFSVAGNASEVAEALTQMIVLDVSTVPPIIHLQQSSFCNLYGTGFVEVVKHRDRWEAK